MKRKIESLLQAAIKKLEAQGILPALPAFIQVQAIKEKARGDFASNVAMLLAKIMRKKPTEIAKLIIEMIPASPFIQKIEVTSTGFINFFLSTEALIQTVKTILTEKENFGRCKIGRQKKVLVEFVSSNPTGPLSAEKGRQAAFGDVIANLLEAVGFDVAREYYINDTGPQMEALTANIWLAYLVIQGEKINPIQQDFQKRYVKALAEAVQAHYLKDFYFPAEQVFVNEIMLTNEEALIAQVKNLLGEKFTILLTFALAYILADIREDLAEFGVNFDHWYAEREFVSMGIVGGCTYKRHGEVFFRSTDFDDEKDRVLMFADGRSSYFANDVAYHLNKFERGFDIAVDLLDIGYQSHVRGLRAAIHASGINPERLQPILMQPVTFYEHDKEVKTDMTLRELRKKVGNGVARLFFLMHKGSEPFRFDLDLAQKKTNANLYFALQSTCFFIDNLLKKTSLIFDKTQAFKQLGLLSAPVERQLLSTLSHYPDIIIHAAIHYDPPELTHYLQALIRDFHAYVRTRALDKTAELNHVHYALIVALQQTLQNGMTLLGINPTENVE